MAELLLIHRLDLIQVDDGFVLESLFDTDPDLTRRTMNRGRDRSDENPTEKLDRLLSRQHEHRTTLVGRPEGVELDFAPIHSGGHTTSSAHPAKPFPSGSSTPE